MYCIVLRIERVMYVIDVLIFERRRMILMRDFLNLDDDTV